MNVVWTKRGTRRLIESFRYIAQNFYLEYAVAFRVDVLKTANLLSANPDLGEEAFTELNRPELRKLLCSSRQHYVYYRRCKYRCEILSVRHTLMDIRGPRHL